MYKLAIFKCKLHKQDIIKNQLRVVTTNLMDFDFSFFATKE